MESGERLTLWAKGTELSTVLQPLTACIIGFKGPFSGMGKVIPLRCGRLSVVANLDRGVIFRPGSL